MTVDKFNRLADGQQKFLHETVGKFIEDHLHEVKGAKLVEDTILEEYLRKSSKLCNELFVSKADATLNDILCSILIAAEKKIVGGKDNDFCTSLIKHIEDRYHQMKYMDDCLKLIHSFSSQKVNVAEFATIQDVITKVSLDDDVVYIEYSMPISNQSWRLIQDLSELHFEIEGKQYLSKTGDFYIESTNDDLGEGSCFAGRIRVNGFEGSSLERTEKAFYRCMIPVSSVDWYRDICTYSAFIKNGFSLGLIELKDADTLLHVYPCYEGEKKYMVIESLTETNRESIDKYIYSIALTLGFVTGTIHLGKCFVFSSVVPEYNKQVTLSYHSMRPSSDSGMKIFTTNMYYVRETLKARKVELADKTPLYDQEGIFQDHLQDWIQSDIIQSLFSLIHGEEKIARAVVTIIESANFPLEYQASVRAIVLETLAHSVQGPKPIPDDKLWEQIKGEMESVLGRYECNEDGVRQIEEDGINILQKKINSMNNPTNADSLARPLEEAGYSTSANDKEALKMRNVFLHGGLVKGSIEKQTDELFYLSLMLHKLSCIVILKRAGFEGYILNNPVLFNCRKAVESKERPLLKI